MSKYKAVRTEVDGIWFDSKREAAAYLQFRALERSGAIRKLDLQVKYPVHSASGQTKPVCFYLADFVVTERDGKRRIYDVKGVKTPVYRLKKRLVEAEYGITIVEI